MPRLSIIVAMDKNQVIGNVDQIPWKLPADLAYFKKTTMGHPVIMGRKTHEVIGRALPGRTNIVVTRQKDYAPKDPSCLLAHSIDEALKLVATNDEVFIIGGEEIYRQTIDRAKLLYVTEIKAEFPGNKKFPPIDKKIWRLACVEPGKTDEKNPYEFMFLIYQRN